MSEQRVWLYGVCVVLCGWLCVGLVGCSKSVCTTDKDCATGLVCAAGGGACVKPEGGGEAPAEPVVDAGEDEPPPFPDTVWGEGRVPTKETYAESSFPEADQPGIRKAGETCAAVLGALRQDRCEKDLLCVSPELGQVGICMTACKSEDDTSCPAGSACGAVVLPDTRALLGYACGVERQLGEVCTFGRPCAKGHRCATVFSSVLGVCLKACEGTSDCGAEGDAWCRKVKDLADRDKEVGVCYPYIKAEGDRCDGTVQCASGLTCTGSSGSRRCRKSCDGAGCAEGHTCEEVKDSLGKVLYSACFPVVEDGAVCDATVRCKQGSVCATFRAPSTLSVCLKDCTADEKVCAQGEACAEVSSSRKLCMTVRKVGETCDANSQCDTDLLCTSFVEGGARFCLKDCTKDAKVCTAEEVCEQLKNGAKEAQSACTPKCSTQEPSKPCTWKNFACLTVESAERCRPSLLKADGTRKKGESCQPHLAAPAAARCGARLQCTRLTQGWICLQPCPPNGPTCEAPEQCVLEPSLGVSFCVALAKEGEVCDLATSKLCEAPAQCLQQGYQSTGRCVKPEPAKKAAFCMEQYLPCESGTVCAGDPLTLFRWTCKTPCDTKDGKGCVATETCLETRVGGACFESCTTTGAFCSNQVHQCKEAGSTTKKACL